MANPIFSGETFRKTATSGGAQPTQPVFQPYGQNQYGQQAPYGQQGYGQAPVQGYPAGYGQAPQEPAFADRMPAQAGALTFDDVMMKTLTVFSVLGAAVVVSYLVPMASVLLVAMIGSIAGLVLGLVNSFKRVPSPGLIMAYAAAEGLFVGGWTRFLDTRYPGIGLQAVLATASIFAVTLVLFRSGKVRATPKLTRFFLIAMSAYLMFSIVNLVLSLTGVVQPGGVRSMEIFGVPAGVFIGLFVIVLGAISLIMDFDQIQGAVAVGAPKFMAWTCAFGLLVTVVWLYVEVLRLLSILRGDD